MVNTMPGSTSPRASKQPSQTPQAQESADSDVSQKVRKSRKRRWSLGREIVYICFGCLGSILGIVFFLGSIGFLLGSRYLENVINDIGASNFTEQMERIDHYSNFFEALRENGYKVVREDPDIDRGMIYYLWQAKPPGSDESRVFRWRHDLEANAVEPLNNPALLLDVKLGYLSSSDAEQWNFEDPGQHYDPGDNLVQAMVNNDFSMINPADLIDPEAPAQLPQGPVSAPLISPHEGNQRGEEEEEQEGDNEAGDPNTPAEGGGQTTDPGASQPVDPGTQPPNGGNNEPPADPGGGGSDPGGDAIDVL